MTEETTLADKLRCNSGTNKEHIRDFRDFIKKLMQVAEDNDWEVAVNDGYEDGFKVISGKDYIRLKVGKELI